MAAKGHNLGKNGSAKVVCGAGTINLSAHGNSTDLDYNADDHEATAYGDLNHNFLAGLTNATLSFSGWWAGSSAASDADNAAATCLHKLVGDPGACGTEFWFAPAGSTSGSLSYAACVNLQSLQISTPADSIITMSLNFTMRSGSLSACSDSVWA